jgi:hypothetical protein
MGGLVYLVIQAVSGNPVQEFDMGIYVGALLGAAVGAGSVFFFASLLTATDAPSISVDSPSPNFDNLDTPRSDPDNPYSSPYS